MGRSSLLCVPLMLASALVGAGCSSDSCETSHPDLCGGGGEGGGSILGVSPAAYTEMNEADNGGDDTAEPTAYVLEDANGIAIEGSFESASPTSDAYIFNSGTFGGTSEPDFPGADIRVFVDGHEVDQSNLGISLGLDTLVYRGYSSLSGAYFINAALFSDSDYVLSISPGASVAGKPYIIEIRGHVEEL